MGLRSKYSTFPLESRLGLPLPPLSLWPVALER
jgi:hypothetical protein